LIEGENYPMLVGAALDLAKSLESERARNSDVLEADLVSQMDAFAQGAYRARNLAYFAYDSDRDAAAALSGFVVDDGLVFARALGKYAPQWLQVLPIMRDGAKAHSERLRELRDRSAKPVGREDQPDGQ
jgi:hypothetical protein